MKKIILISVLLLIISNLFGISGFASLFTLINPSATDVAFGLDSGTANIWNISPLSVWSNPAKLGYHKTFSFGYSHDPCFHDTYHRSSYISYGWSGIGILLPAYSAIKHFGTVMSFGEWDIFDETGVFIETVEFYYACSKFAVGINTLEFISNFIHNEHIRSLQYYGDLSVGFNYNIIHSELDPQLSANAHSTGIGFIGRISPLNKMNVSEEFYRLDLTAGVYFLNPGRTEIFYSVNETLKDPLPWGTRSAFSGKLSFNMKLIPSLANHDIISLFCNNIFSIYYSQDNAQYGEKDEFNPSIWGEGVEFTFFDIFSYRKGQHVDREGESVGNIEGYGINLSYKDIIQFQYNKVKFPVSDSQEKTDYMVRIDFLKAYELFR